MMGMEMETTRTNSAPRFIDKIYGGLNMSWPVVIVFAVATAVLTSIFLIFPVFKDTSFERMGVFFEAWIFFALLIIANCKKPLESAVKTFVFFLISQPLIYLFQVPFTAWGWGIFQYYPTWFIWTLLTFPIAYVGWYITKRNWLSLLILVPAFIELGIVFASCSLATIQSFPHLLIAALFCLLQIVLYIWAFLPNIWQKIVGALIVVFTVGVFVFASQQVEFTGSEMLPGHPYFSEDARIELEDASIGDVHFVYPDDGVISYTVHAYGDTILNIYDGDTVTAYNFEVYNDNGTRKVIITPLE